MYVYRRDMDKRFTYIREIRICIYHLLREMTNLRRKTELDLFRKVGSRVYAYTRDVDKRFSYIGK